MTWTAEDQAHDRLFLLPSATVGAEGSHEKGRVHAFRAKRWLEATTRVQIHFTAYDDDDVTEMVKVRRPDGTSQAFDLYGVIETDGKNRELYVESKGYSTAGKQGAAYKEFLSDAYCSTVVTGEKRGSQFMWVTWHPFSQGEWPHLCAPIDSSTAEGAASLEKTAALMAQAAESSGHLGNDKADLALCRIVAHRIWLVVLHERQERFLVPSEDVLIEMRAKMLREART